MTAPARGRRRTFDCLIIGGGHNGLIAAAYLAASGKSVAVLERRSVLGGCACTEELWTGYKVSVAAYVLSLLSPDIIRDLRLHQNGLVILPRDPSSFTPLLDGRYLLMGPNLRQTVASIAQFSAKDAETYPRYLDLLGRVSDAIEPLFDGPAPNVVSSKNGSSVFGKVRELSDLWGLYERIQSLGGDLGQAAPILLGGARETLEHWFESEALRATLATDALIGGFSSLSAPGTGYLLLHHVMGKIGGARGVWAYVQGGMGGLADALERTCEERGVTIFRETAVSRILTNRDRVVGVEIDHQTVLEAPIVASSVDARTTFLKFLEPASLPKPFVDAIKRIDYKSGSAKINLALSEAPVFRGVSSADSERILRGTIHIGPTLDYLERAWDDAKYGRPSNEPLLEITVPTSLDSTIAPPGKHLMSMFVQYAPYQLADGKTWDEEREAFGDRCVQLLGRYAPNVPGAVEHRQVLTPMDLEKTFGLTGGHIMQGAMDFGHLLSFRPALGYSDYRTPVRGLYLCGAASHPGGGVLGACGRNAAAQILRDQP